MFHHNNYIIVKFASWQCCRYKFYYIQIVIVATVVSGHCCQWSLWSVVIVVIVVSGHCCQWSLLVTGHCGQWSLLSLWSLLVTGQYRDIRGTRCPWYNIIHSLLINTCSHYATNVDCLWDDDTLKPQLVKTFQAVQNE